MVKTSFDCVQQKLRNGKGAPNWKISLESVQLVTGVRLRFSNCGPTVQLTVAIFPPLWSGAGGCPKETEREGETEGSSQPPHSLLPLGGGCRTRYSERFKNLKLGAPSLEGMAWPTVVTTSVAKQFRWFAPDVPNVEACHLVVRQRISSRLKARDSQGIWLVGWLVVRRWG